MRHRQKQRGKSAKDKKGGNHDSMATGYGISSHETGVEMESATELGEHPHVSTPMAFPKLDAQCVLHIS